MDRLGAEEPGRVQGVRFIGAIAASPAVDETISPFLLPLNSEGGKEIFNNRWL
jgi:hypothetical protein